MLREIEQIMNYYQLTCRAGTLIRRFERQCKNCLGVNGE